MKKGTKAFYGVALGVTIWWLLAVAFCWLEPHLSVLPQPIYAVLAVICGAAFGVELLGVLLQWILPVLFLIFACIAFAKLPKTPKGVRIAFFVPPLLAGLSALAEILLIAVQPNWPWFPGLPNLLLLYMVCYLLWAAICIIALTRKAK